MRFYLPLDEQLANPFFGQVVIVAQDFDARVRLMGRLQKLAREAFVGIDVFAHPLDLGPPVGRPIQYRIGGPDIQTVRRPWCRISPASPPRTRMSAASSTTGTSPERS